MVCAASDFSSVPILDYSLATNPTRKPEFIEQLRHALINVGFLYLSNTPVRREDVDSLTTYIPALFSLPQETKDRIAMANSEHFLGYSRLGSELTRGETDFREQFDFGTPIHCRWKPGDPEYFRIWGESQWPEDNLIPGFKETFLRYLANVKSLSYTFISLIAEAFGLPPNGLDHFYDADELMQHRTKIVKYPVEEDVTLGQGVGPHYDAGFLTFLLQASPHEGLQVQNLLGQWIDVPPIPGTFVVNIGKALEFVTQGLARATSHRVLLPKGPTPRYSVPFFQNISLTACLVDNILQFPPHIAELKETRGIVSKTESVNFTEYDREPSGRVILISRIKSHPDTGKIHYPELFRQLFPLDLADQTDKLRASPVPRAS